MLLSQVNPKNLLPSHPNLLLKAFYLTNLPDIKVVIIGQDPYPSRDVATGVAFGCKEMQPSLAILLKELVRSTYYLETESAIEQMYNSHKDTFDTTLEPWCKQGVLMLNCSLTCEVGRPGTHIALWKKFMSKLLRLISLSKFDMINDNVPPIVFAFLGKEAQQFKSCVNTNLNKIIEVPHPAAEVYGGRFIGCNLFQDINKELTKSRQESIRWLNN